MKIKKKDFSKWYNKVVRLLVDDRYGIKGNVVLNQFGTFILNKIYEELKKLLEEDGHKQVTFPILIPEKNFEKEKEHVKGFFPEVYWVTEAGKKKLEEKLALRPTSESAFYPMYSIWINGRSDLPLKLFQFGPIFRYETKATKPLIRGREFYWIESHDAFASEEEAKEQVKKDMEIIKSLFEKYGIPFIYFKRPEWDKFAGAVESYAADTFLPDGKRLQVVTTHFLGQNFSKAYNIRFKDSDGKLKYVYQTCFGPGIYRIIASIISIHGDEYGLVLPFEISPIQVVVIPIKIDKKKIEKKFKKLNLRILIDDSEDSAGEKFYKWEMYGVPIRVEIGEKEIKGNYYTLFRRDERKRIKIKDLNEIKKIGKEIDENLRKKAKKYFDSMIVEIKNEKELKKLKKIGRANICEKCARKVEKYGFDVFGDSGERKNGKCIFCGKETNRIYYFGKSY